MKGILLVNLGTPDSSSVKDVRKFLREFLMDPLVVDLPFVLRWILVNLIIVPFRGPKSSKEYKMLWTKEGSPLKYHSEKLLKKLKEKLTNRYQIALAMRYQSPSIKSALLSLQHKNCDELLIIPLFPQYAQATSLSVINAVKLQLEQMSWVIKPKFLSTFATDEGFIDSIIHQADELKTVTDIQTDHTVFSYHGLPERQLIKVNADCLTDHCCSQLTTNNEHCYRAQCFATTRALAKKLKLSKEQYSVCFQSRQGRIPWTQPYIDEVIVELAKQGRRHVRVFSPAFVADCLETTIEIGQTYRQLFIQHGGEELTLVPSLNSSDEWVDALQAIINKLDHSD